MRLLKGFILALAGLFIVVTLVSLLIPSKVVVSRGVVVNATASKILPQIVNLHNWEHWHPVFKAMPGAMHYSKDTIGPGSFCEWENNGKKNKLLITAQADNQVSIALVRKGENDVINILSILPLADSGSVQVEWRAQTKLKWYPWEKFYGIFIEKLTGQGYDDALNSLKTYVEAH
jgi:hypothetical protein